MFTDNSHSGFFNSNMGGPALENQCGIFGNSNNRRANSEQQKKSKVFTPVSVKMVQQSQPRPDDVCEFDGDPINDIIIVGRLLRKIDEPMRTQFEINDNSGTFHVLFYHKGENQVPTALRNFQYQQFGYAKIYGNIRVFKEEKAIVGTHIKRIDKFDELTNHFISVMVAHCIRKKGVLKPRELAMEQQQFNALGEAHLNNSAMLTDQPNHQGGYNPTFGGAPAQKSHNNGGSQDMRKAIMEVMREMNKNTKFVNKQNVYSVLQNRMDRQTFEKQLEAMVDDGDICQAFDRDHFFIT